MLNRSPFNWDVRDRVDGILLSVGSIGFVALMAYTMKKNGAVKGGTGESTAHPEAPLEAYYDGDETYHDHNHGNHDDSEIKEDCEYMISSRQISTSERD